jgi:putative SOS response-associated peptidase YedK
LILPAGLWKRWSKIAEPVESCTILTTAANALLQPYHDRMPVILSQNDYDA